MLVHFFYLLLIHICFMFLVVQFGLKDCRVWIGGDGLWNLEEMILERGEVEFKWVESVLQVLSWCHY